MYQKRDRRPVPTHCPFCEGNTEPDYKNVRALKGMLTDKGKIIARTRTGVCMRHQRHLARAVKRARFMAMLPFVANVRTTNQG